MLRELVSGHYAPHKWAFERPVSHPGSGRPLSSSPNVGYWVEADDQADWRLSPSNAPGIVHEADNKP